MFKSLSKYNILKSKKIQNTIIIILIAFMLFMISWMFFLTSIRTIRSILSIEGMDDASAPSAPFPTTEIVSVSIAEDKLPSFSDTKKTSTPVPLGKYYLMNEQKSDNPNILTLGADPSGVSIDFDVSMNTKLIIYPTNVTANTSKTANTFPDAFTVNISFPDLSKNYMTKYVDSSGNIFRNYIDNYTSPNKDISGNFVNVVLAIPNIQSPIYLDKTSTKDIGIVQNPSTNNLTISVTSKGSMLNGILINMKPPSKAKK